MAGYREVSSSESLELCVYGGGVGSGVGVVFSSSESLELCVYGGGVESGVGVVFMARGGHEAGLQGGPGTRPAPGARQLQSVSGYHEVNKLCSLHLKRKVEISSPK